MARRSARASALPGTHGAGFSRRRTVSIPLPALESQRLVVRTCAAVVLSIAVLSADCRLSAQTDEWFGTWRLNLDKSVYNPGPAPYKRATMKVERLGDRVRFSYDFVYPRGGVQHLEWDGTFDGNDYVVQGADEYMTYAYKQTAERAYEIVAKVDGQVVAVATVTISPGGRTLTTVTRGTNNRGQTVTNTTVHEKVG